MNKFIRTILILLVSGYFLYYAKTYTEWHFIDSVNLIFHEAGHSIFIFFGMFVKIAAGSGLQLAIPAFFVLHFYRRREKISSSLCLLWVGQNLLNISMYAGDAQTMQLNLLGGGSDSIVHDWNYLLSSLGVLSSTHSIASAFYSAGIITILLGIVLSISFSLTAKDDKK